MAEDDPKNAGSNNIPPKVDLFKKGVLKDGTPAVDPSAVTPAAHVESKPVAPTMSTPGQQPSAVRYGGMPPVGANPAVPTMPAPGSNSQFASAIPAGSPLTPAKPAAPAGVKLPDTSSTPAIARMATPVPSDPASASRMPPVGAKPAPALATARPVAPALAVKPAGLKPLAAEPAILAKPDPATAQPAAPTPAVPTLTSTAPGPKPLAVKPVVSTEAKPAAQPMTVPQPIMSKRETSKIPLAAARIMPGPGPKPAGIHPVGISAIKPVAAETPSIKLGKPVTTATHDGLSKHTTSRISLESVLAGGESDNSETAGTDDSPKTIRLKRPSATSAIKIKDDQMSGESMKQNLAKTSRLDEVPVDEESATKRRTVRVKRSSSAPATDDEGQQTVIKRSMQGGSAPAPILPIMTTEDEPGPIFIIAAIAAMLVVSVTIYMFMAQALGPDVSHTPLSYGARDLDLPWPGKISTK